MQALLYFPWLEFKRLALGVKHSAEVDVTDNCNLRCRHCYHFFGRDELNRRELPLYAWRRRFEQLHRQGVRFILLVGGEPALRIDVLMAAHEVFPFIFVITNGTIRIPTAFQHRLFVSIDGRPEINDRIRGKGVYDRVLANYEGDPRVVLNMVLGPETRGELEHVVRLSRSAGFSGVVCNIYTPRNDGYNPWAVDPAARRAIVDELRRVKRLYPDDLLVSETMMRWYAVADHRGPCYWGDGAHHYDVSWRKRRCFAPNADCANCGCLAGALQSPLRMIGQLAEVRRVLYEV